MYTSLVNNGRFIYHIHLHFSSLQKPHSSCLIRTNSIYHFTKNTVKTIFCKMYIIYFPYINRLQSWIAFHIFANRIKEMKSTNYNAYSTSNLSQYIFIRYTNFEHFPIYLKYIKIHSLHGVS